MGVVDDSLVLLKRRQVPPLQTGRGNYATTWTLAGFYITNQGVPSAVSLEFVTGNTTPIDALMFGSDVPFLQTLFSEDKEGSTFPADLNTYCIELSANLAAIYAWATSVLTVPYAGIAPPTFTLGAASPIVCRTGQNTLERPTGLSWPGQFVIPSQGSIVTVQTEQVENVQGFPVRISPDRCLSLPDGTEFNANCFLWVGFEAQINAGLGIADATGAGADEQPAYTPIILRRADYSPQMRANNNVITVDVAGTLTSFLIVGLWA